MPQSPPKAGPFEVECPCCRATLKIDPATQAVLTHQAPARPRPVEDLAAAAQALRGEEARREELFQKSFEAHRKNSDVLARKFEELFQKAKEDDPAKPPPKPPGLD